MFRHDDGITPVTSVVQRVTDTNIRPMQVLIGILLLLAAAAHARILAVQSPRISVFRKGR